MKALEKIYLFFITMLLLLVYVIIVDGALALGICIISLGISSGIYILPTIVGGFLIYMSFINSEVLCQDLEYIIQGDTRCIIDNDGFCREDLISNTSKEITESEENNDETLSEKMNILKKEYSHYQSSNNDYFIREVKEQLDTVMRIQDCINNLEKIAKKQVTLQIEEVWEKITLNVVDNLIQCFVYANYINLNNEFESVIVKLTQENKKLLENQELLLNNIIMAITNKMLEKKEKEHKYLILELDAMQAAISNVINTY